ncbi:uncharacterized protein LOC125039147 [Penaeus chinensis]|uniref:uncharacterized protein LOC125039147 n=1 Tax=Penaeus chinensis TaxID=139456 RepID=UPI001FB5B0B6|nr:uncharacterized protein LOC125039147 [Penaeus chinensis]
MLRILRLLMLAIWIQEICARPCHLRAPPTTRALATPTARSASASSSASNAQPGASEVDDALRELLRRPRSVSSSASEVSGQQQQRQLSYISFHDFKFRLKGILPLYLRGSSSGVSTGYQGGRANQVCFRVHTFHATPAYPEGQVVALETPAGGSVLRGEGDAVSLMPSAGLQDSTSVDDRFFLFFSVPGDPYLRVKHLSTGHFLSASSSGVTLDVLNTNNDNFFFQNFRCT